MHQKCKKKNLDFKIGENMKNHDKFHEKNLKNIIPVFAQVYFLKPYFINQFWCSSGLNDFNRREDTIDRPLFHTFCNIDYNKYL